MHTDSVFHLLLDLHSPHPSVKRPWNLQVVPEPWSGHRSRRVTLEGALFTLSASNQTALAAWLHKRGGGGSVSFSH